MTTKKASKTTVKKAAAGKTPAAPPLSVQHNGMALRLTRAGLPNSCTETGEACTEFWYAASDDAAIAGNGYAPSVFGSYFSEDE